MEYCKYWLDTEFNETDKVINLISIALVSEDGRTLHYGNANFDYQDVSPWVADNVLVPLGFKNLGKDGKVVLIPPPDFYGSGPFWKSRQYIKEQLMFFLAGGDVNLEEDQIVDSENYKGVELWANYASTDFVAFYQIFGTLMDLPEGLPMYIHDIQQELDRLGIPESKLPKQESGHHNALEDAKWCKQAYEYLSGSIY